MQLQLEEFCAAHRINWMPTRHFEGSDFAQNADSDIFTSPDREIGMKILQGLGANSGDVVAGVALHPRVPWVSVLRSVSTEINTSDVNECPSRGSI